MWDKKKRVKGKEKWEKKILEPMESEKRMNGTVGSVGIEWERRSNGGWRGWQRECKGGRDKEREMEKQNKGGKKTMKRKDR